jgi:hypothetical protein
MGTQIALLISFVKMCRKQRYSTVCAVNRDTLVYVAKSICVRFSPVLSAYLYCTLPTHKKAYTGNTTHIIIRISYSICNPCTEFHVARMQTKFCPGLPAHKRLIRPALYGGEWSASFPGRFTPAPTGYEVGKAPMPFEHFGGPCRNRAISR